MIHAYQFLSPQFQSGHSLSTHATETRIRERPSRPPESVFVAVDNLNEIIGFFEVLPTRQEGFGEIRSLFVCSAFWGRGVGTRLLNDAEQLLCARVSYWDIMGLFRKWDRKHVLREAWLAKNRTCKTHWLARAIRSEMLQTPKDIKSKWIVSWEAFGTR